MSNAYFPPRFFPAQFFGSEEPQPIMANNPYFPGGYFAGKYFGAQEQCRQAIEGASSGAITCDTDALWWVRERLKSMGLFAAIRVGRLAKPQPGQAYPACWVNPVRFGEADNFDPISLVRTLTYEIAIAIRPEDQDDDLGSMEVLDAIANAVMNCLDKDPPLGSVPALSQLTEGKYPASPSSQDDTLGVVLSGTISYLVEGRDGRGVPED